MTHVPADARRAQFIDAAIRVIASHGVDGATTRRIAEEAHASHTTLHYCFQTRENLLFAVCESLASRVRIDTAALVADAGSLIEVAEALVTRTMQYAVDHREETRATYGITYWAQCNNAELSTRMYDVFLSDWQALLSAVAGERSRADVESIVRMVTALIDGLAMQLLADGDAERTMRDTASACAMLRAYLSTAHTPS